MNNVIMDDAWFSVEVHVLPQKISRLDMKVSRLR